MIHKKSFNARLIFSGMVPISALAFLLGFVTLGRPLDSFNIFDGVSFAATNDNSFLVRDECGRSGRICLQHLP